MRVMWNYSGSISSNPCSNNDSYGETEDYLILIGGDINSVGSRANIDNTTYNVNRHSETGGRGVRQF